VKAVRYLDFRSFASAAVERVSRPLLPRRFEAVVRYLKDDYLNGVSEIVRSHPIIMKVQIAICENGAVI
jgi:hypothetical protein